METLMSRPVTARKRETFGVGRAKLVRDEITVMFLDWVSSFKLTDAAAAGAWHLLNVMMPDGLDVATFSQVLACLTLYHTLITLYTNITLYYVI